MGGCTGRVAPPSPGLIFCEGPSQPFFLGPSCLCLHRFSSHRPPKREKREDRSLIPTYIYMGQGESGPPKSHNNPNVHLSTSPQVLSLCCC